MHKMLCVCTKKKEVITPRNSQKGLDRFDQKRVESTWSQKINWYSLGERGKELQAEETPWRHESA